LTSELQGQSRTGFAPPPASPSCHEEAHASQQSADAAVWLYFRFPLGLRMVEELLAARGIIVSHETVQQWARKFG
jgi:putative transposase